MLTLLRRGAVVRHAGHFLLAWSRGPDGRAFGFAVHPQTRPLHRAQVPLRGADVLALGLAPGAWTIDTRAAREVDPTATIIAHSGAELVMRIESALWRDRMAQQREAMTG